MTLPLKLPAEGGVNFTLKEMLWPEVRVSGGVIPEILNPVPLTPAAVMCASEPPVFFTVSVCVELFPT